MYKVMVQTARDGAVCVGRFNGWSFAYRACMVWRNVAGIRDSWVIVA